MPAITPRELRELLDGFRRFLVRAWSHRPTSYEGCWPWMTAEEEWVTSHWEILVEHPLRLRFGGDFVLDTYEHPGDNECRFTMMVCVAHSSGRQIRHSLSPGCS